MDGSAAMAFAHSPVSWLTCNSAGGIKSERLTRLRFDAAKAAVYTP
jgi:hypothetical protein